MAPLKSLDIVQCELEASLGKVGAVIEATHALITRSERTILSQRASNQQAMRDIAAQWALLRKNREQLLAPTDGASAAAPTSA